MATISVQDKHLEINRRELLRAAGVRLLAAAGATALGAGLTPAEAAVVTPNPITPRIQPGLSVEIIEFSTPPRTSASGAKARLNFLYHHRVNNVDKLFVNDTRGKIWSLDPATGAAKLFLDLAALRGAALIKTYYQQGLRSFAFHPNFAVVNAPGYRKFYTVSTETAASRPNGVRLFQTVSTVVHHNVVTEWQVDAATLSTVVPSSRRELFRIAQWREDHCADQLMFNPHGGSDFGKLYLTVGDGGNDPNNGDPFNQAQNPGSALGKILRFVPLRQSDGRAYAVPSDNPFVGRPGWLPEIWALGLRHPQNLSFDVGGTGKLICTDIGHHHIEEVNVIVRGGNYGWPLREGTFAFAPNAARAYQLHTLPANDAENGFIYPVAQYDHDEGNTKRRSAIAGGFVYRGSAIPSLTGHYICGDIVTGRIFHVPVSDLVIGKQTELKELTLKRAGNTIGLLNLVAGPDRVDLRFGQDRAGEIYVLTKQDGKVRKLARAD